MKESINLDQLLPYETLSSLTQARVAKQREERSKLYFGGQISLQWWIKAGQLPGKALHIALAIGWISTVRKKKTIPLQNYPWIEFQFDRTTAYRALRALEIAKLISIDRRRGRHPMVTILDVLERDQGRPNNASLPSLTGVSL